MSTVGEVIKKRGTSIREWVVDEVGLALPPPRQLTIRDNYLTDKMLRFCDHYIKILAEGGVRNPAEALRRAGYPDEQVEIQIPIILRNPNIQAILRKNWEQLAADAVIIDSEEIIKRLSRYAFEDGFAKPVTAVRALEVLAKIKGMIKGGENVNVNVGSQQAAVIIVGVPADAI